MTLLLSNLSVSPVDFSLTLLVSSMAYFRKYFILFQGILYIGLRSLPQDNISHSKIPIVRGVLKSYLEKQFF